MLYISSLLMYLAACCFWSLESKSYCGACFHARSTGFFYWYLFIGGIYVYFKISF